MIKYEFNCLFKLSNVHVVQIKQIKLYCIEVRKKPHQVAGDLLLWCPSSLLAVSGTSDVEDLLVVLFKLHAISSMSVQ